MLSVSKGSAETLVNVNEVSWPVVSDVVIADATNADENETPVGSVSGKEIAHQSGCP